MSVDIKVEFNPGLVVDALTQVDVLPDSQVGEWSMLCATQRRQPGKMTGYFVCWELVWRGGYSRRSVGLAPSSVAFDGAILIVA